jgi:chemotaxis protein MotA
VFLLIGLALVAGSIIVGYTMHGGSIAVLIQINEFIILGGCALGSLVLANPMPVVIGVFTSTLELLKPNPYNRKAYAELLQVLYDLFHAARRDGLVGIEQHIEEPEKSDLFGKYPTFMKNHHAVSFLSDTMKVMLTGAVDDNHLSEILDLDLEQHHAQALVVPTAMSKIGDSMPGFGIVAAVLGVIITMGHIGGAAEEVGRSVASALVGTFLGVLLAYGVVNPMAQAVEVRAHGEDSYMKCIRTAVLSFARGDPPITSVEFARRNIEPHDRPSFSELEDMTRKRPKAA